MSHGPTEIANLAREIDATGDYTHSISQLVELIKSYGDRKYEQGEMTEMRYPRSRSEFNG